MNIFKKLFIPNSQKVELTSYITYNVRWRSRHGNYSSDTQDELEVFTNKEEAELFAKSLKDAFKLVKNTSETKVTITKN